MEDGQLNEEQVGRAVGAAIAGFMNSGGIGSLLPSAPPADGETKPTLDELFVQATQNRDRLAREVGGSDGEAITVIAEDVQIVTAAEIPAEDKFWLAARKKIGIQEEHTNALLLTATLFHVDKRNLNGDFISRAEAEAALPSLAFQPIDMAPEMDRHQRERLYSWANGIRGFIYASRIVEDRAEVGVVIWARDFPEIAQKIVDFRASLGASFDLVASNADITDIGTDNYQRNLKGITFLGGALLAKSRAGDPDTTIGNVRYTGKPIEQLEEDQRMANDAKQKEAAQAATQTPEVPATETPTVTTPAPAAGNAVEVALAEAQARVKALEAEVEQASLKVQAAELKQQEATTALTEMTARAEKAEGELTAQADAKAKVERIQARFTALETMAAEAKRVLFEGDEAKEAIVASIADLDDNAFETFKLRTELDLLRNGKPVQAEKQEEVEAQAAARNTAQPGVFSGLTGTGAGTAPGSESPRALGHKFVAARKGAKTE